MNYRYTDKDRELVMASAEKGISDSEIVKTTGFGIGFVGQVSAKYWKDKMRKRQIDNYLIEKFPGGNCKICARELGISVDAVKARVYALRLDANIIFEIVKTDNI